MIWLVWSVLSSAHAAELNVDRTLPNPDLTPGAVRILSLEQICDTRWGLDHRAVTQSMKMQVFHSYGLTGNADTSDGCKPDKHGRRHEIDHLAPRCAGGADMVANLWAQCYSGRWNANLKDKLEVAACKAICNRTMTPQVVYDKFRTNWKEFYIEMFGDPYQ
jgi:hypothetical protein